MLVGSIKQAITRDLYGIYWIYSCSIAYLSARLHYFLHQVLPHWQLLITQCICVVEGGWGAQIMLTAISIAGTSQAHRCVWLFRPQQCSSEIPKLDSLQIHWKINSKTAILGSKHSAECSTEPLTARPPLPEAPFTWERHQNISTIGKTWI